MTDSFVFGRSSVPLQQPADEAIEEQDFTIGPDVATLLGPGSAVVGSMANSKTIRMRDRDFIFDDGDRGFTLTDMSTTVTRMTHPATGQVYLQIYFNYAVTSLGWRTGAAYGETAGIVHGLYFRNRDGGNMWSWGFPADDIRVQCGWNRHPKVHHITSTVDVSWFDEWKKVAHSMYGTMYPC